MDFPELEQEIASLRREGAVPVPEAPVDRPGRGRSPLEGKELLNFASNNYLGLANHPEVVAAFTAGAARYGVGTGASRLISGHMDVHAELEEAIARFKGAEGLPDLQLRVPGEPGDPGDPRRPGGDDLLRRAEPLVHHRRLPPAREAAVEVYRHADPGHLEAS